MTNELYFSMEELAPFFNTTSRKIGQLLKKQGYRSPDGKPTPKATSSGLVKQRYGRTQNDKYNWVWSGKQIAHILQQAGLTLVPDAPAEWLS